MPDNLSQPSGPVAPGPTDYCETDDVAEALREEDALDALEAVAPAGGETKDVHTEHCCVLHGCKYSDPECTVETGKLKQSFPCESCHLDRADNQYRHDEMLALKAQLALLESERDGLRTALEHCFITFQVANIVPPDAAIRMKTALAGAPSAEPQENNHE